LTNKIWPDCFKLDDKIVVVTGAGLIGSVVIKGLAEAGAVVIISEFNEKLGRNIELEFKKEELKVIYKHIDITSEESVEAFLKDVHNEFGKIDAWVNTAYPRSKDWGKKSQLLNFDSWKENLNKHLGGYYLTSIMAAELMKENHYGSIVNFGSTYGITAPDFSIYEGTEMTMPIPYAAIKGGINMLTKYIATYYGKFNIRANVIAPGGVFDNQPKSFVEKYTNKVPLKRMAKPKEIAGSVIFLVSDASSYITGHILMVDGGWTIW